MPLDRDPAGPRPPASPAAAQSPTASNAQRPHRADAVLCERCQAEMFRMHAVWRCPSCGYKTDCCGW